MPAPKTTRSCECGRLEIVDKHTYLGLVIDSTFNWGPHIGHICNKLRSILCKLSLLKCKLPFNTLRMLYMSLAESILSYSLSSYGRTYKTYLDNIYKIQLSMVKTIVPNSIRNKYKHDEENLFRYCKIINVHDKFRMMLICDEISNLPYLKNRNRSQKLRNISTLPKYIVPSYNNAYGKRVWEFMLPYILNKWPGDVCHNLISNPHKCKSIIKNMYLPTSEAHPSGEQDKP